MKRGTGLHVGSSSILVVFVLLCLTTFATLSMVSANADYRLSEKTADASQRYYRADGEAERFLSEIDAVLADAWLAASNPEGYRLMSQAGLESWASGTLLPADGEEGGDQTPLDYSLSAGWLSFRVPIDGAQALAVSLELYDYGAVSEEARFRRAAWKVVSLDVQDYEEITGGPEVWDGGDITDLLGL